MYNFTFGTYNGLFVECDTPAVLPNDVSYFDFRRRNRRAIPDDNSPNVVIRKIFSDNDGNAGELLLVALIYKAQEGVREGFIGFGSILTENHTKTNIKAALQNAISLANRSGDYFSEGKILNRPKTNSSEKIDLRDLPIKGEVDCFGQIKETLSDPQTSDTLAGVAEALYKSLDSFEIVINENNGLDASEIGPFLTDQANKQNRAKEHKKQAKQKALNEEKLRKFAADNPKETNTVLIIGISLAAISVFCAALIVFLIFRTGPSDLQPTIAEIIEEKVDAIDKKLPIKEETENISNDEETIPDNLTKVGCENIANTSPQAGEIFLSSRIDFLNKAADKSDGCIELGNDANDFFYADNDKISHIKYEPQTYDNISNYLDGEFSDNEFHLMSFRDFLASFDNNSSTYQWLVNDEYKSKYGLAVSLPKINAQTMYCTPKIFELVNDPTNRFKLAYLSQPNELYEELIKTMATGFRNQFSESWSDLSNEIDLLASTSTTDSQSVEIMKSFILDNILLLETTNLDDLTNIEAQENLCVLSFSEQDQLNLSKIQNLKEVSLNEYFKKAHGLEKIREVLGINDAIPFEQYLPNCIGIPEYILVWNTESPATSKGILKDFDISIKLTTEVDFKFVITDAIVNDDLIQLPEVDTAIPAFRELERLMEVNAGSPFAPDFVPVDQLCYNN